MLMFSLGTFNLQFFTLLLKCTLDVKCAFQGDRVLDSFNMVIPEMKTTYVVNPIPIFGPEIFDMTRPK